VNATDRDVLLGNRRRLGSELRQLREQAGLSGRELAERIGISQSKVSRIESGAAMPTIPEMDRWSNEVSDSSSAGEMLRMLADAAYKEVHSWDDALPNHGHLQDSIRELEVSSGVKLTYGPSVVPGLLQTAEYARRLFTLYMPPYAERDIPALIAGRLERQTALFDPAHRFEFLITETALRLRIGPTSVLVAQLDRIASLITLENVDIGLIPSDAAVRTHVPHGFGIFEQTEGGLDALVLVETVHANLIVSAEAHVGLYRQQWSLLRESAVFGVDARSLLVAAAEDVRRASAEDA
jgi:transcriptional regulator with XRE-family HTH domain